MATKFGKKVNGEDAVLAEFVDLNKQIKELEKKIDPLKMVVLEIVKARGDKVEIADMSISVASRPKLRYSEALEAEIRKVEEAKDFVELKKKRAKEHGEYTIIDPGEYVICKVVKKD